MSDTNEKRDMCKEFSVLYDSWFWAQNLIQTAIFIFYSFYTISKLKNQLERKNYLLICTFCVVLFLRLSLDTVLYFKSNFGERNCVINFNVHPPTDDMI